jgi:hypothetical protein
MLFNHSEGCLEPSPPITACRKPPYLSPTSTSGKRRATPSVRIGFDTTLQACIREVYKAQKEAMIEVPHAAPRVLHNSRVYSGLPEGVPRWFRRAFLKN